jgi:hypothetical protein
MKKLFLVLILAVGLAGCKSGAKAMALDLKDIVSDVHTGAYFSLDSKHWEFTTTFKAIGYKGFNLNLGYSSPDSVVAMVGYEVAKLEKLGVEVPVLKNIVIDAGWLVGFREPTEEAEFTQGPAVTLAIKF